MKINIIRPSTKYQRREHTPNVHLSVFKAGEMSREIALHIPTTFTMYVILYIIRVHIRLQQVFMKLKVMYGHRISSHIINTSIIQLLR